MLSRKKLLSSLDQFPDTPNTFKRDFVVVRVVTATSAGVDIKVPSTASVRVVKKMLFQAHPTLNRLNPGWFYLSYENKELVEETIRFSECFSEIATKWANGETIPIHVVAKLESASNESHPSDRYSPVHDLTECRLVDLNWIEIPPFAEELILPKSLETLPAEDLHGVLTTLLPALDRGTATHSAISRIILSAKVVEFITTHLPLRSLWENIEHRLARNRNRVIGIHGGGNIGLGLVAQVFSMSSRQYKILATTSKDWMANIVNATGNVWIQQADLSEEAAESPLGGTSKAERVTLIGRDSVGLNRLYQESTVIALCLTAAVLTSAAPDIAAALVARYRTDKSGVTILVCMNVPNPAQFVSQQISAELEKFLQPVELIDLLSVLTFVPTVVDRIVVPIPEETVMSRLRRDLSRRLEAPVLETVLASPKKLAALIALFGLKCPLFSAEEKFEFWVPNTLPEAAWVSGLTAVADLSLIEIVKNKLVNGPHAILAWLGALSGRTTIAEAMSSPLLACFIRELIELEIAPTLLATYPDMEPQHLQHIEEIFLERCVASVSDPVLRVARDPLRKLQRGARVRGTLELAQALKAQRPGFETPRLIFGIAAGFLYAIKNLDPQNSDCQLASQLFQKDSSFRAVLTYVGEFSCGTFSGFDEGSEAQTILAVLGQMSELNTWYDEFHIPWSPVMLTSPLGTLIDSIGLELDLQTGQLRYKSDFVPMSLDFQLLYVRHGETYGNCGWASSTGTIDFERVRSNEKSSERRIFQGNVDTELNALNSTGLKQAERVAEVITARYVSSGWFPDVVLVSPLSRTKDTSWPFFQRYVTQLDALVIHPGIAEMSFGAWENRRVCDFPTEHQCHKFYLEQNALVKENGVDANGIDRKGENFCEVLLRARSVLLDLNHRYAGKRLLMFSHSMFGAAVMILLGKGVSGPTDCLTFDGKNRFGDQTLPHAQPIPVNFVPAPPKMNKTQVLFQGKVTSLEDYR